jgi:hypothetical protein
VLPGAWRQVSFLVGPELLPGDGDTGSEGFVYSGCARASLLGNQGHVVDEVGGTVGEPE